MTGSAGPPWKPFPHMQLFFFLTWVWDWNSQWEPNWGFGISSVCGSPFFQMIFENSCYFVVAEVNETMHIRRLIALYFTTIRKQKRGIQFTRLLLTTKYSSRLILFGISSSNNHNEHPSIIGIQIGKQVESYILFCIAQFQRPSSHICLIYLQFPCYLVIEINYRLTEFLKKQIEAFQVSSGTSNMLVRGVKKEI